MGFSLNKLRSFSEHIKFEHTVFALPFAYLALLTTGQAGWDQWFWVTVAMVGARTAGMSANRLIDARIDARNQRTRSRPLQTGALRNPEAWAVLVGGILLLEGACLFLNLRTLWLSPVALVALIGYSYLKRWTWGCHFGIGATLALAPLGATLAVTGQVTGPALILGAAVLFWVAGFDILYALLDIEFDRSEGLHSIPASWGVRPALWTARLCHLVSFLFFYAFGMSQSYNMAFWMVLVLVGIIFVWEHTIVREDDFSRVNQAFFTANGWVGVLILIGVILELVSGGAHAASAT